MSSRYGHGARGDKHDNQGQKFHRLSYRQDSFQLKRPTDFFQSSSGLFGQTRKELQKTRHIRRLGAGPLGSLRSGRRRAHSPARSRAGQAGGHPTGTRLCGYSIAQPQRLIQPARLVVLHPRRRCCSSARRSSSRHGGKEIGAACGTLGESVRTYRCLEDFVRHDAASGLSNGL